MKNMINTLKNKLAGLLAVALLSLALFPGLATAQSSSTTTLQNGPTADQYDPPPARYNDPGNGLDTSVGGLPFTGFDVIAMLAVALTVTGLGLALQRAVSREPRDLQ